MQSKILIPLLQKVWQSPVFGDSFKGAHPDTPRIVADMQAILKNFSHQGRTYFTTGMPEWKPEQVDRMISQMAAKTVGFCPALSAGEFYDVPRLSTLATLIALTGWGNQHCDRGDPAMRLAILQLCGLTPDVPADLAGRVASRLAALRHIETTIHDLALPEDEPYLLRASRDELMLYEVRGYDFSREYLAAANPAAFLRAHTEKAADIMTVTGAVPSATTPLYAVYRQHDPSLPSLAEVYSEPHLLELLQVFNIAVRVFDDLGDRHIDDGTADEWGAFSLNIFNQPEPLLVAALCRKARLTDRQDELTELLARAPADPQVCHAIVALWVEHLRRYVRDLPTDLAARHQKYIALCKRAIEAGYINQVGDMALVDD